MGDSKRTRQMKLTYGSLFAGVGGFDMGMELAGYEPVFQVEWDKNCLKVLHHHWPTVPKWHDVCDVNGVATPVAKWVGEQLANILTMEVN
jgi:DNA (cytosine-5)-methyltransferase 1